MFRLIIAFLLSFALGLIIAPLVIWLVKKVGARQNILHYVSLHMKKEGTPTMGGLIFLLPSTIISCCFFGGQAKFAVVALGVTLGFSLLGFLDDFIKVYTHKNLGLRAYQKIIGQLGIGLIVALFVYFNVGSVVSLANFSVDIGWGMIPFVIFVLLAMTNSANLTDGLDGLAGWTSFVMLTGLGVILGINIQDAMSSGDSIENINQLKNLQILSVCVGGGVLAFLCFNSYPAQIFMGDTGSLALGGVISILAILSNNALLLPIISFVFVVSAISVVIQVVHFKRTKRRVFLMAPLHHHFEKKGVQESKIVVIYIIVTLIMSLFAILLV